MPNHPQAEIAIIGGSGLYEIQGFTESAVVDIDTPYGKPSDFITVGELLDVPVAFLPRHGLGHRVNPTELPFRANIYALKTLGVKKIVVGERCWAACRPASSHNNSWFPTS